MKLSRSVSFSMRSKGCPLRSARMWLSLSRILMMRLARIWMSEAWPSAPPSGWWIITSLLGRAKRLPLAPAVSRNAPMEAAIPTQMVETSALMNCMVS
ncbi:hypothetical protein D3C71_2004060 [compost metagenome]